MRHSVVNNKFRMKTAHRIATFRNMAQSLIEHGRIETTLSKAKMLRTVIEPLITLGKRGDLAARRLVFSRLPHTDTVHRLFDVIAPVFKNRNGGYTRIMKLGRRLGDNAERALIEFVDPIIETREEKVDTKAVASAKKSSETKSEKAAPKKTSAPKKAEAKSEEAGAEKPKKAAAVKKPAAKKADKE